MKRLMMATLFCFAGATLALPQEPAKDKKKDATECPLHEQHMKEKQAGATADHEHDAMNKRGEDARGMGFTQSGTVHHFLLGKDGGAIQVEVKDANDRATIDTVRAHLQKIASSFSAGDFSIPEFVHGTKPDGMDTMQAQKQKIQYRFEELPAGGRVVIASKDKKATNAVHEFLRFQIVEHRTGDPLVAAGSK